MAGGFQLRIKGGTPAPGLFSHASELSPFRLQVPVNVGAIGVVESKSPKHLFSAESLNRFRDPLGGFAAQVGIDYGVQRDSAPKHIVSAAAFFDVVLSHIAFRS